MVFPTGLRALNHRDFRIFWSGQLVSLVGTWMQSVGQAWLVLQLTASPFKLGLIGTLQFTPVLLFSVVSGVLADRLPKQRLILATQTVLMTQSLTLAALVWTGHVQYWHVAGLALVLGFANTLDMPARQSFIVEMVGRDDVMSAVALNSASFNGARVVGPAVAGLLIARYGIAAAFALNGFTFVAVLAALLAMRTEGRPRPRRGTTVLEEMREGIRYALETPRVALVLGLVVAVSLFVFNFTVFVPLLARDVLHQDAEGFGFLMAALGVGAVTGALVLGALGRRRPPLRIIFGSGGLAGGALLALAPVHQFWVAMPLLFVLGFFGIVFMASCNTTLQVSAPDELRGRVMSLHTLTFGGVFPIGAFLTGTVAETLGVATAFVVGGGGGLLSLLAIGLWWRARGGDGSG